MSLTDQELFERYGQTFAKDDVLFREGDTCDQTYIIISGSVKITKSFDDGDKTLAVIPANEFFGEMATLLGEPRSATATVLEDSRMLVVNSATLESMINSNNKLALNIIKKLAGRIRDTNKQLELMLFKDASRKIFYCLANAADSGEQLTEGQLAKVNLDMLSTITGVDINKVKEIIKLLFRARLLEEHEQGYVLTDRDRLFRYLEYIETKEKMGDFASDALQTIIDVQRAQLKR